MQGNLLKLSEYSQQPWRRTTLGSDYAQQLEQRLAWAPDPSPAPRASVVWKRQSSLRQLDTLTGRSTVNHSNYG